LTSVVIELTSFALERELISEEIAAVKTYRSHDRLLLAEIISFDE
jgi:hypothetical protein